MIWCNIPACGTSYYERKGCAVDMVDIAERHVFVVDDEVRVLEAIEETLGTLGVQVACFVHPAKCLERLRSDKCDLLIADLRMPEMDGIELLGNVKHHSPWVPVLIVTGYGDIPSAVQAIKAGAVDFIEKPLHKDHLLRVVESILQDGDPANKSVGRPLTAIQTRVLKLVVAGKSNREIADILSRSVRTIEVHRAHLMEKLGVKNLLDLVKRASALGLVDFSGEKESADG